MAKTVETLESFQQLFDDIFLKLSTLQTLLKKHRTAKPIERVSYDKEIFEALERMEDFTEKVNNSILFTLERDARQIESISEKQPAYAGRVEEYLKHIRGLLTASKKEEFEHRRAADYLLHLSIRLEGSVSRLIHRNSSLKRKWEQHTKQVQRAVAQKQKLAGEAQATASQAQKMAEKAKKQAALAGKK